MRFNSICVNSPTVVLAALAALLYGTTTVGCISGSEDPYGYDALAGSHNNDGPSKSKQKKEGADTTRTDRHTSSGENPPDSPNQNVFQRTNRALRGIIEDGEELAHDLVFVATQDDHDAISDDPAIAGSIEKNLSTLDQDDFNWHREYQGFTDEDGSYYVPLAVDRSGEILGVGGSDGWGREVLAGVNAGEMLEILVQVSRYPGPSVAGEPFFDFHVEGGIPQTWDNWPTSRRILGTAMLLHLAESEGD